MSEKDCLKFNTKHPWQKAEHRCWRRHLHSSCDLCPSSLTVCLIRARREEEGVISYTGVTTIQTNNNKNILLRCQKDWCKTWLNDQQEVKKNQNTRASPAMRPERETCRSGAAREEKHVLWISGYLDTRAGSFLKNRRDQTFSQQDP